MTPHERLQKEYDELEKAYELLSQKIQLVRNEWILATDAAIKFRLETEVKTADADRNDLRQKLDALFQKINLSAASVTIIEPNPYRIGGELTQRFVGRQNALRKIQSLIATGQHVSIIGDRTVGKTTLLNQYAATLQPEALLIRLSGHYTDNPDEFFEAVISRLVAVVGGTVRRYDKRTLTELLGAVFKKRRVIISLDEFETLLTKDFKKSFFDLLRYYGSNKLELDVSLITLSKAILNKEMAKFRQDIDQSSPFFNIFQTVRLLPFDAAETDELIALADAYQQDLRPYRAEIVALGGGLPYFLQLACHLCFEALRQGRAVDIAALRAEFAGLAESQFRYIFEHSLTDPEQARIIAIAKNKDVPMDEITAALTERGYIRNGSLFSTAFDSFVKEQT